MRGEASAGGDSRDGAASPHRLSASRRFLPGSAAETHRYTRPHADAGRGAGPPRQGREPPAGHGGHRREGRRAPRCSRSAGRASPRDPGGQRRRPRPGCGRRHGAGSARSTPPHRSPPHVDGRRPPHGGRAARPGRRDPRRVAPPQRAADRAHARPARRGRDHLREPPERHERRGRALPEGGERRAPARLGLGPALEPRRRDGAARRHREGGAAGGRRAGRRRRLTRGCRGRDAAHGLRRLPGSSRRPGAHPSIREHATVPVVIDGDGNCHVYVDTAADLDQALDIVAERQDEPHQRVQRGRVAGRPRGDRRRVRPAGVRGAHRARRRAPRRRGRTPALARDGGSDRGRLRSGVPRPQAHGRGRPHARRRDRARQPLRHRPHRGDPHDRSRRGAALHRRGRRRGRHGERVDALHRR